MPDVQPQPVMQTPPPKEVISPPMPGRGPMHKHTGFIIAIALTSLLLIGAAVMAYLSWDTGTKLAKQNAALQYSTLMLQQQNSDLQTSLDEEMSRPGPIPFFYVQQDELFTGPTDIHAVDPMTGTDTILLTVPEGNRHFEIVAQPRTGWDGRIFLNRISEGDNPGWVLYEFDTVDGTELVPSPVQPLLPFSASAILLAPDQHHGLLIFDTADQPEAPHVQFIDLLTATTWDVMTLGRDRSFADRYFEFGGIGNYQARWTSYDCVRTNIYQQDEEGNRKLVETPEYCLSDFIQ